MKIGDQNYKIIDEFKREYYYYAILGNNSNVFFYKKTINNDIEHINALNNEIDALKDIESNRIPKIVSYAYGEYILYEYIDGIILKNIENLDLKNILIIILGVLRILRVIHSENYVHNDLKMGNIIIGKDNKIYLIDFGNATKNNQKPLFGSRDISSLELLSFKEVDNRSDIYSIGVLLYELICKKNPYDDMSESEILESKNKELSLDNVSNKLYSSINEIIEKCTNPIRENRYQTVDELIKLITKLLDDNF